MSELHIPLDGLGAEPGELSLPIRQHPLDNVMSSALESPSGLRIEFSSERHARATRFKFYHRRRALQKMGIYSFDLLVIGINNNILHLERMPEFKIL